MKIHQLHFTNNKIGALIIDKPREHKLPEAGQVVEVVGLKGERVSVTVEKVGENLPRVGMVAVFIDLIPRGTIEKGWDMVLQKQTPASS